MTQMDTSADLTGGGPGRPRRGRRRLDSHTGDRCRMCRQVVIVDDDGRCALGHQVVDADEMAARLEARADGRVEGRDLGVTTRVDGVDDLAVEVTIHPGLPPTVPAAFTTPAVSRHAPDRSDPSVTASYTEGQDRDRRGARSAPRTPGAAPAPVATTTDQTVAAPDVDLGPAPASAMSAPPVDRVLSDRGLFTRGAVRASGGGVMGSDGGRETRWVPGLWMGGMVPARPRYLPRAAAGRRLGTPGDHALPVLDEDLPPLPGPPVPDGPRVARALFHDIHGDVGGGSHPDVDATTRNPLGSRTSAATAPTPSATRPSPVLTPRVFPRSSTIAQPVAGPRHHPGPPADPAAQAPARAASTAPEPAPAPAPEPIVAAAVHPVPTGMPSHLPTVPSALAGPRDLEVVGLGDLDPSASSVLDLDELPPADVTPEPVYEPEPVGPEAIPPRGPGQWLAGGAFLSVLALAAWYLAITL